MKILHIALTDGGGAGMGLMNQHRALLQLGVDSRVLVAIKQSKDATITEMRPNQNVWGSNKYVVLLQKIARRMGLSFNLYDRTHRDIYKIKKKIAIPFSSPITQYDVSRHPLVDWADVINLHFISGFVDIPSFFKNVKKPIVWTMRDENPGLGGFHYAEAKQVHYKEFSELEDKFLNIKRNAIESCSNLSIVSLSEIMRQFCDGVDFLANRPNTIIYNAISPDDYTMFQRNEARHELGINPDNIVLSFVCCQFSEKRKRFAEVLQALDILGDKNIKLLCVGKCDVEITSPNVIALGSISDRHRMSLVYSASDVFVTPSAQESFGKTVVEALYCGTPVVSTSVGIAAEIINESNGALCGGTPSEIAEAIRQVLGNKYNQTEIRRLATEKFAPENVARQYFSLYNEILKN